MAVFVPGHAHDIFVSYAHVNNQPPPGGDERAGWCGRLVEQLRLDLAEELGRGDIFDLWMDRRLTGNEPFGDDIRAAVQGAATLLVFLSPGYLRSPWCLDELRLFVESHGGEEAVRDRIFVVRLDELDDAKLPPAVRKGRIDGYTFYKQDPLARTTTQFAKPIPNPGDPAHQPFYTQVRTLAKDLAATLPRLLDRAQLTQSVREAHLTAPAGPAVFLAEVPQELFDTRLELASYLGQSNPPIRVVPDPSHLFQWQGLSADEFRKATDRALADSVLFVQLLGRFATPRTPELPAGYAEAQRERAQAAGKPILRWRSRDLALPTVPDPQHKQTLQTGVTAMPLDELKRTLVEQVRFLNLPKPTATEGGTAVGEGGYVLINAQAADLELADQIAERLAARGVGYDIEKGDAPLGALVQKYGYDALMVVYGECDPEWVPRQVRQLREVLLAAKGAAPKCAVYIAPPPEKRPLRCRLPQMIVVDRDVDRQFQAFAAALRHPEAAK